MSSETSRTSSSSAVLALLLEHPLELEGRVEVVLDRVLAAPRDDDDALDPGVPGFLDDVLDEGPVHEGQHFLGLGLGGRQEAGAEAGGGEDGDANLGHGGQCSRPRTAGARRTPVQYEGEFAQSDARFAPGLAALAPCFSRPAPRAPRPGGACRFGARKCAPLRSTPSSAGILYCGTSRGNFYESRDGGATWEPLRSGPAFPGYYVTGPVADPAVPGAPVGVARGRARRRPRRRAATTAARTGRCS